MSVQAIDKTKQDQTVTAQTSDSTQTTDSTEESKFEALMLSILKIGKAKEVSEEDLFAGLIRERIQTLKGDDAAQKYDAAFEREKTATRRADGRYQIEDAARAALVDLQNDSTLTVDEADSIHSQAFAGAQLDNNLNALYDGFGGPNDPTRAVMVAEQALQSAKAMIDKFTAGTETPTARAAASTRSNTVHSGVGATLGSTTVSGTVGTDGETYTPTGTVMDGPDGFLYKPVSSQDGKLAVIMSSALAPLVEQVRLVSRAGDVLEQGRDMGIGEGARRNFRFSKQGSAYPNDLYVEALLTDGTTRKFLIPDSSQRYD